MSFVRLKEIPPGSGNYYSYRVHSERDGDTVRQIFEEYLGRSSGERTPKERVKKEPKTKVVETQTVQEPEAKIEPIKESTEVAPKIEMPKEQTEIKNTEDIVLKGLDPNQRKNWEIVKPQNPSVVEYGDKTENIGGKITVSKEQFELGYDDVAVRHELLHDTALENEETFAKNVLNAGNTVTDQMHPSFSRYTDREKISEDFVSSATEWLLGTRFKDDLKAGRITPEEVESRMSYFDNFAEHVKESKPQQIIKDLKERFNHSELVEQQGKQYWKDVKDGELFAEKGDYPEYEPTSVKENKEILPQKSEPKRRKKVSKEQPKI